MKDHPALAPSRGRGQMAGAGADQQGEADAASQLQDLIRNALANSDAKEDRSGDDLRLARGKPAGGRQSRPDGRTDATDTPSESKRSAADHKEEGAEKGRAREGSQAGAAAEGSKSAREGAKGPSGALYGTGDPVPSEPANSQKFALRLMGSSAARMQIEPQGKGEPAISAEGVGVGAEASLPEIGEQEVPDSALHRAEISPEHEAILGRIFLRD
jgi:hypothetical protein